MRLSSENARPTFHRRPVAVRQDRPRAGSTSALARQARFIQMLRNSSSLCEASKQAGKAAAFRVSHDHDVADVRVWRTAYSSAALTRGDGIRFVGRTRLATFRMTNRSPGVASGADRSTGESLQAMTRA